MTLEKPHFYSYGKLYNFPDRDFATLSKILCNYKNDYKEQDKYKIMDAESRVERKGELITWLEVIQRFSGDAQNSFLQECYRAQRIADQGDLQSLERKALRGILRLKAGDEVIYRGVDGLGGKEEEGLKIDTPYKLLEPPYIFNLNGHVSIRILNSAGKERTASYRRFLPQDTNTLVLYEKLRKR